ncbi:MAG: FeoB-associated Cys-rich membrane protein [Eubacteriaceae bacterium]|nr:FeoB-associated Cys-rich membrane protein [Eubacteriaceae bacterium]
MSSLGYRDFALLFVIAIAAVMALANIRKRKKLAGCSSCSSCPLGDSCFLAKNPEKG